MRNSFFVEGALEKFLRRFGTYVYYDEQHRRTGDRGKKKLLPKIRDPQGFQDMLAPKMIRRLNTEPEVTAAVRIPEPHLHYEAIEMDDRHRRHREVRFLFSWLKRMGYIEESPFAQIKNIRLPQKIVQPYTAEEIGRLLGCCDSRYYWGSRNRTMILILLDTGVRRTELVDLDLADLDLEGQRLRVLHGKGNKQRVVRFGTKAREAVEDYLERFRGREPGALFLSRHGTRMSSHSVLIFLRRLGGRAGVEKVKVHRFRHTFATWAVENEARELDVQHLLGHSTPAMVRRYSATYDAEKAARAHERFSPADRMGERLG